MPQKGYDVFVADPGAVAEKKCVVCGSKCGVERNVYGPTGFVEAMCGRKRKHDLFQCPHSLQSWHLHALKLAVAIDDCPSPRVARLMRLDLDHVLRRNLPGEKRRR